jgi:hypothetical protein
MWAARARRPAAGYGSSHPSTYALFLGVQLLQRIWALEDKPPVTLVLMGGAAGRAG